MADLEIIRGGKLLIRNRTLNIYVNDVLIDTMPKGVNLKKNILKEGEDLVFINSGNLYSNRLDIKRIESERIIIGS